MRPCLKFIIFPLLLLFGCKGRSIEKGSQLFVNYACVTCHSMEGAVLHGPPLDEIWQEKVLVLREGKVVSVKADRTYLTRSIMQPDYEKLVGFESKAMPNTYITPREAKLLVDYIVSVNRQNE